MENVNCLPITTPQEWAFFTKLIQDSFSADEYRNLNQIESLAASPSSGYIPYIIYQGENMVGLITMWDFSGGNPPFLYYEHFAISPELRGSGIGTTVLDLIINTGKSIIIETALPTDEISKKRVKFYQKLGFKIMNIDYVQPAYSPDKKAIPMQIMYIGENPPYQKQVDLIKIKVYKTNY